MKCECPCCCSTHYNFVERRKRENMKLREVYERIEEEKRHVEKTVVVGLEEVLREIREVTE